MESTYDDLDRQVTQTVVERRPTTRNLVSKLAYDDAGDLTSSSSPTGATTVNTFNGAGDITRSTAPTGEAMIFGCAGGPPGPDLRRARPHHPVGTTSSATGSAP